MLGQAPAAGRRWGWVGMLVCCLSLVVGAGEPDPRRATTPRTLLYVALPGIRNYTELGGAGVALFDTAEGYRFVRRIETPASQAPQPENVKGIAACAATGRLYFTTLTTLYCVDLRSEQTLWSRQLEGGCDRLAITPDGKLLFVPSLEGPHWNVVSGEHGDVVRQIVTNGMAHNTICSSNGRWAYLAGRGSPILPVVDVASLEIVRRVGPFSAPVRPFTVNSAGTRTYVTIDELLGFEVGDLTTGEKLARVEVTGLARGKPARHGCPSHGIALAPDEQTLWLCDAANRRLHVFDLATSPPRQMGDVRLRDEPGWVSFSLDGRRVIASTGEIIDAASREIVARLVDEQGRPVHSEKLLEISWHAGAPLAAGNQFGVGRKGP